MLGIDNELEQLYKKAQQDGEAVIKDRWTSGNYGCCSTHAPLVEKYKIKNTVTHISLYFWGTLVVEINLESHSTIVNLNYEPSNYEKKIIDWFAQHPQNL